MRKKINESKVYMLDDNEIRAYEKILNLKLKKYDWFYDIKISRLSHTQMTYRYKYMGIEAEMFIDKSWAEKQYIKSLEITHGEPITDRELKEKLSSSEIVFPDLLHHDKDLAYTIKDIFLNAFTAITGIEVDLMSYTWIDVKLVEPKNKISINEAHIEVNTPTTQTFEKLVNKSLKKYDWFDKIDIEELTTVEFTHKTNLYVRGKIYVDESWAEKQIEKSKFKPLVPVKELFDVSALGFSDLFNEDERLYKSIQNVLTTIFLGLTGTEIKYVLYSGSKVILTDKPKQITESDDIKKSKNILIKLLKQNGVFKMFNYMGNSYGNFVKVYGIEYWDHLTDDEIISNIREFLNEYGYVGLNEIGMEPITRREDEFGIHQIEYLGSAATVQVWGGYNYSTDEGEYRIQYENLKRLELIEILDGMFNYVREGFLS